VPTYVRRCKKCTNVFDVYATVQARNALVRCPVCNAETKRIIATPFAYTEFRAGLFPVGKDDAPVYIGDRRQLKEACKRQGLISHYLEGSPSTFKQKPWEAPKWTEQDDEDLKELYHAVDGAGVNAKENATKWLEDKQR